MSAPQDALPPKRPLRVLFVCTHNAVRSPMAHGLTRRHFGAAVDSASAGVYSSGAVDSRAVSVMAEIGVDLAAHRPADLGALEAGGDDLGAYDIVVALSGAAADAAQTLVRYSGAALEVWPVDDATRSAPADADAELAAFRAVRDALSAEIRARFSAAPPGA